MPTVLDPNASGRSYLMSDDLGYSYAQGLNMRPDSPDHQKLVKEVYTRALESSNEMSKRYESWKKVDKTLTAYVKLDESEKGIKDVDNRRPVSIVVPYSYATLETILTYFTTAFLESPIFRYEGSSPEDIVGAILMEKVIDQHVQNFKVALNLHTMFRDSLSYGLGVVSPTWDRKWGWKAVVQDSGFMSSLFAKFISTGPKRDREETILYEGNRLKNIDPYRYLPDPNVPIHDVQQGEFVGWIESTNYMKLIELEKNDPDVFNVKYLKGMTGDSGKSQFNKSRSESGRSDRFNLSTQMSGVSTSPIDVVWMYWTLIPKDQRLGGSEYPEKWLIGLAADKVIICAKQLSLNHDMYPVAVCAPDYDGYSSTPVSRLELMYGMQEALDWLFNSHISNVRKAINDMLIVDPSLINMADLEDPRPGKLIRMRRAAWGRGVENAVKQLQVSDITKSHISDAASIIDYMQRTSAATDSLSGMVRKTGERVTAEETKSTRSSALSRLTKAAKIASLQAMRDIGYMFAVHTQQMMKQDTYIKAVGQWPDVLMQEYVNVNARAGRVKVTPFDLIVDYDIVIKDGSVQGSEYADSWIEVFRVLTQQPMLFQSFDMVRIFKHIARIMGAKDINEFVMQNGMPPAVNAQVMRQDTIDQGVQQGNVVPIEQMPAMGGR
ncbi:MAG: hypothetical protein WC479_12640 [Candidatus Izemoplasmatales bacterium]